MKILFVFIKFKFSYLKMKKLQFYIFVTAVYKYQSILFIVDLAFDKTMLGMSWSGGWSEKLLSASRSSTSIVRSSFFSTWCTWWIFGRDGWIWRGSESFGLRRNIQSAYIGVDRIACRFKLISVVNYFVDSFYVKIVIVVWWWLMLRLVELVLST